MYVSICIYLDIVLEWTNVKQETDIRIKTHIFIILSYILGLKLCMNKNVKQPTDIVANW